jgi:copper chaperone CopZ
VVKKTFKISGMHCASCAFMIEGELEDRGIKARCDFVRETVEVEYEQTKTDDSQIIEMIEKQGYKVVQ